MSERAARRAGWRYTWVALAALAVSACAHPSSVDGSALYRNARGAGGVRSAGGPAAATDSAGCGCHSSGPRSARFPWLAVLGAFAWVARQRRRWSAVEGEPAETRARLDSDEAATVSMPPSAADVCACITRPGPISIAMVGELVAGRYRVTRHIADGGMGVVCEAVHVTTGRHVALKIVRNVGLLGDERDAWITRFRREARAVGSLESRHVTQIFDAGTDEASGQPFIAMELLEGADLARVLKHMGPLPPTAALKIVGQACLALERAHAAGIIHRDIKPANVFLTASDSDEITVKLVDFGVAKIAPEAGESELTQTGSILGTPTYMSPEQAKGTRALDHRADLWALAVVLYKALTGRVPHSKRDGLGELILTICTKPAPPVQDHAPWVSPDLAHLLDRALQLDIAERFQSAAAFREQIEAMLPDGLGLRRSALRPLTYDERSQRAPRLISTFPPPPKSDPTASSAASSSQQKKWRSWLAIGIAAAFAAALPISHFAAHTSPRVAVLTHGAVADCSRDARTSVERLAIARAKQAEQPREASDGPARAEVTTPKALPRLSRSSPAPKPAVAAERVQANSPTTGVRIDEVFE